MLLAPALARDVPAPPVLSPHDPHKRRKARGIEALPPTAFAAEPLERAAIYQRFFHGPQFQVLDEVSAIALQGLLAEAHVDHSGIGRPLRTMPLVLEAAFQAAGLHRMAIEDLMALPARIGRVAWLSKPEDGEALQLMVQQVGDRYHVDVAGVRGPVLRLRDFELIDTGPLPEPDRIPEPTDGWPLAITGRATASAGSAGLDPSEWSRIQARGTPRRQADRVAGHLAARAAVTELLGSERAFRIAHLASGAPFLEGLADAPAISISHSDGEGMAIAVTEGRVGIDRERVAVRPPSFTQTWFTAGEQALVGDDAVAITTVWALKEAVLKLLGTGMAITPLRVEICVLRPFTAELRLHGAAAAAAAELGPIVLSHGLDRTHVVAVAAARAVGRVPGARAIA